MCVLGGGGPFRARRLSKGRMDWRQCRPAGGPDPPAVCRGWARGLTLDVGDVDVAGDGVGDEADDLELVAQHREKERRVVLHVARRGVGVHRHVALRRPCGVGARGARARRWARRARVGSAAGGDGPLGC